LATFMRLPAVAGLAFCALAAQARADESVADFFRGKTITIAIGFPAGGGYDIYGRLAARHLGKYIPGNPNVIAQNMIGAGGLKAANWIYSVAPKDGTALGVIPDSSVAEEVLGTPGIAYKSNLFTWIGRISSAVNVTAVWHTAGISSIDDVKTREVIVGGSGPTAAATVYPRVLNAVAGTKFKLVTGYGGAPESCLAMERQEIQGCLTAWSTVKAAKREWLDQKLATLIIQWGTRRHPELPNLPAMTELAKTDEDRQVLALYGAATDIGKSLVAPPGLPDDRVQALRSGFLAMLKDPELLDEVQKASLDFDWQSGEELQKFIATVSNVSPAVIERARQAHDGH
jgi:tripartite-type tricarboxylate transporter receptor subunit TctC